MKKSKWFQCFTGIALLLLVCAVPSAFAAGTAVFPDYSQPVLIPSSQAATAWTNVIPNALASYYTYVPYSNADAVALGFPATCGNKALIASPADQASTEDCYTITVRKVMQDLALPAIFGGGSGLIDPATNLPFVGGTRGFAYGSGGVNWTPPGAAVAVTGNAPAPFVNGTYGTQGIWHFPSPSIRGTKGRPIRVQWLNELPNEAPVGHDPTVDGGPNAPNNFPYNRIVIHLHGAHVADDSDGFPEAWFTPNFALTGSGWTPSIHGPEGTYFYPMDQEAATLWYHDHASGLTHLNTQMGLAGFCPITDANEQALIAANKLPTGVYELGFALQDRVFDTAGQFAMPDYPVYDAYDMSLGGCTLTVDGLPDPATCKRLDWMKAADGHLIPYVPGDPLLALPINAGAPFGAISTTLEYFGNMPMVNGVTYGTYTVEQRIYRIRFIGGTDSRTWVLRLEDRASPGVAIPFWQIGSEQGLLPNPVSRDQMDLLPGERLDVLVNLTGIPAGHKLVLRNLGPDTPYGGPATLLDPLYVPSVDIPEVMEFNVVAGGPETVATPSALTVLRPAISPLEVTPGTLIRNVSLVEGVDQYGRVMPTIDGRGFMAMGMPTTEVVRLNDVEEWNIINNTMDAHPIHLHLVAFQVINKQAFDPLSFVPASTMAPFTQASYTPVGPVILPDAWEAGWKDTIDVPPGMVVKVRAKFDVAGNKYVWHCHILSHEEHDMMRPLAVVTANMDLLFTAGANGSLTGTTSQNVAYGGNATAVTAVPNANFHFVNWTGPNGFVPTTTNPLTLTNVTGSQHLIANFAVNIPAVPSGLTVTPVNATRIDLGWTDNSPIEDTFEVQRRNSGCGANGWTTIATLPFDTVAYQDNGVNPGFTYGYRLRATNISGSSGWSACVIAVGQALEAPGALTVTGTTQSSVTLGWTDNSAAETSFQIQRKDGAVCDATGWATVGTVGANVTAYTNAGLAAGTTYTYRARANVNGYSSAWSGCATGTTTSSTASAAPSGMTATAISAASISLGWTDNSNNETGFHIQWKQGAVCDNAGWATLSNVAANTVAFQLNNRPANATYIFRVRAANGTVYSAWSGCASTTTFAAATVAPAAPSGIAATPGAAGQVAISWTDNQPNLAASSETLFVIQRKAGAVCDGNGWAGVTNTATNVTSYNNVGLTTGNTYSWRVRAANAAGSSAWNACATAVAP